MSLGSWNPADGSESLQYRVDPTVLVRCAMRGREDSWGGLAEWVESLPVGSNQMMKLDAASWVSALAPLDEETLWYLVRFFTAVEQQLPQWHGGDKSPVIWIARTLKKRGTPLSREQVLWVKGNSDNRFLPNGPVL